MANDNFIVEITVPSASGAGKFSIVRNVIPNIVGRAASRCNRFLVAEFTERQFLNLLKDDIPAYIWSDVSTEFLQALKSRGVLVFREKFNGLRAHSREILDAMFNEWNEIPSHDLTDIRIHEEMEQLQYVDYIFVSNPVQQEHYGRFGIAESKIIASTYGWEAKRFIARGPSPASNNARFTALFVGRVSFEKGAHVLLEAWGKGGIDGDLVLAGVATEKIQKRYASILCSNNVKSLGWVEDVGSIYRSATVFVFPSFDEGGPLVTYEAMGCGLPVIVSPMGAGAIARHGIDGFVIDPYDRDGWIEGLRRLATDHELRRHFAHNAAERAKEFTWDKVGAARRQAVLERQSRSTQATAIKADAHPRFA